MWDTRLASIQSILSRARTPNKEGELLDANLALSLIQDILDKDWIPVERGETGNPLTEQMDKDILNAVSVDFESLDAVNKAIKKVRSK